MIVFKHREDFYASIDRTPEYVLLVIEISDTTLSKDRNKKLQHYARSKVPEFWIEDLKHDLIHVYRDPEGNGYNISLTLRRDDSISPLAFPGVAFKVADLLG